MVDYQSAAAKLAEHYGSREGMILQQIIHLSTFEQPCDVTFYKREPMLNMKVSPKYGAAMMYGAGAAKMMDLLSPVEFADGSTARLEEIWTLNPIPKESFTEEQLAEVDLSDGDAVAGPGGETVREMIARTYHAKNEQEVDRALRRFLAS